MSLNGLVLGFVSTYLPLFQPDRLKRPNSRVSGLEVLRSTLMKSYKKYVSYFFPKKNPNYPCPDTCNALKQKCCSVMGSEETKLSIMCNWCIYI